MLFAEIIQRRESSGQRIAKEMLESGSRRLTSIVLELMTTGDRSVYGPLLLRVFREALDDRQYITAMYCAEAIGNWRLESGVSLLATALGDSKAPDNVRSASAVALGAFEAPAAISALARSAREDTKTSLPRQCTQLLVKMGPGGIKAVGDLLASGSADEQARLNAADALAQAPGGEAASFLLSALKAEGGSYSMKLRATAAASLGPLSKDNEDILNTLIKNMKERNNDPMLRNACMNGLGMSDNPKAIPHLIEVMGDPGVDNRKFTRNSVHQMLRRLTGERRVGQYKDEWLRWWENNKDRFEKKP